ncbi:MAG: helix-turn-helix transcriptional regulator [Eubacterium sp.]
MFTKRLNETRKNRGITAQYMADSLQTGIRNYRKYESGDAKPTIEGLIKIADILDVSIDYLLCRDEWLKAHGVSVDEC